MVRNPSRSTFTLKIDETISGVKAYIAEKPDPMDFDQLKIESHHNFKPSTQIENEIRMSTR